jgi:hypothetical protein
MNLIKKTKILLILLTLILTTIISNPVVHAFEIQDSATCYGYRADTYEPKGIGTTYLTHNEKVGFWVQISDPPSEVDIRVIWKDPDGVQYDSNAVEVKMKEGTNWGIIFDSINIASSDPENDPGKWRVELSIDHNTEVAREFNIIDFNVFMSSINEIQEQVEGIIDENNNLQNELQLLTAKYTSLQANYTRLQAQTGTSTEYEELQNEYDALEDEYRDLQVTLSTTRMMMYGAVIIAIVSVAVAVYFGAMKR